MMQGPAPVVVVLADQVSWRALQALLWLAALLVGAFGVSGLLAGALEEGGCPGSGVGACASALVPATALLAMLGVGAWPLRRLARPQAPLRLTWDGVRWTCCTLTLAGDARVDGLDGPRADALADALPDAQADVRSGAQTAGRTVAQQAFAAAMAADDASPQVRIDLGNWMLLRLRLAGDAGAGGRRCLAGRGRTLWRVAARGALGAAWTPLRTALFAARAASKDRAGVPT